VAQQVAVAEMLPSRKSHSLFPPKHDREVPTTKTFSFSNMMQTLKDTVGEKLKDSFDISGNHNSTFLSRIFVRTIKISEFLFVKIKR